MLQLNLINPAMKEMIKIWLAYDTLTVKGVFGSKEVTYPWVLTKSEECNENITITNR